MNPVLLVALPLGLAFLSLVVKKYQKYILVLVALFAAISTFFLKDGVTRIGGSEGLFAITFYVNTYTVFAIGIVNILMLFLVIIAYKNYHKFSVVMMIMIAGFNGIILTQDLFNLFVFMEILAIAGYIITATHQKPGQTLSYIVQGTIGSVFYLLGVVILYVMTGTLDMAEMWFAINQNNLNISIPLLMIIIGLGVEIKILPFNNWVKGILESSNTLTGPLFGSIYSATFLFVFAKIMVYLNVTSDTLSTIIVVLFTLSIIAGEAMAYQSKRLKHVLLFSSVAQAGLIAMVAVDFIAVAALMIGVVAVTKFVMFLIANKIEDDLKTDDLDQVAGVFKKNPIFGASFTVGALSMLGMPFFAGFIVKMYAIDILFVGDHYVTVAVLLLSTIIEAVYMMKVLGKLWYGDQAVELKVNLKFLGVSTVLSLALIIFGLTPFITDLIEKIYDIVWMVI